MSEFIAWAPAKPVGCIIPWHGLRVDVLTKPSRFHLWMMRVCFGWKWEDAK